MQKTGIKKMKKAKLRKKLQAINDQYKITGFVINQDSQSTIGKSVVKDYANCLNNPNLAAHLLKTGICPDVEALTGYLSDFQKPKKIIESFQCLCSILEQALMIEKITPEIGQ